MAVVVVEEQKVGSCDVVGVKNSDVCSAGEKE